MNYLRFIAVIPLHAFRIWDKQFQVIYSIFLCYWGCWHWVQWWILRSGYPKYAWELRASDHQAQSEFHYSGNRSSHIIKFKAIGLVQKQHFNA